MQTLIWICRIFIVIIIVYIFMWEQELQNTIDNLWEYLLTSALFNHVTFETIWTVFLGFPINTLFYILTELSFVQKYKLDKSTPGWEFVGIKAVLIEILHYATPLLVLDFFTVKKYVGVDPVEWTYRRRDWIQSTRALPTHAPSLHHMCVHLAAAFVLYDIFFGVIHFAMHKSVVLYKYCHSEHHHHPVFTSKVTNQLSFIERTLLVLSANEALKLVGAHPLTRVAFVPLFLLALTENHCGYDLPWSWSKVIPGGVVAGAARHWSHHMKGDRYYAPFFTIMDDYVFCRLAL